MTVEECSESVAKLHIEEAEILSNTDAEVSDTNEQDESANADDQPVQRGFPEGTIVIPDETPDYYDADADLTSEFPADTEYINLIHLKIRSFEDLNLGRFQNLKTLCLRENLLDSISGVKVLNKESLEELDVYDNRINHISKHINEFSNLRSLDLSFNKIKNIKNIDKLGKLETLYFVQNKISEIKNLETLKSLKSLELGGNRIEVLSETLLQMPTLEELWLGKNKIRRFENLNALRNLKILSIQSNRLTKLEGLDELENLEELYVSHNGISKLEGLEKNTKLTTLDITANRISKLENLKHLTQLTDLWASYNKIDDWNNIHEELGSLPELETVYLEGNPIQLQNPPAYRRKVKLNLGPSLKKIDATYITANL